MLTIVCMLN